MASVQLHCNMAGALKYCSKRCSAATATACDKQLSRVPNTMQTNSNSDVGTETIIIVQLLSCIGWVHGVTFFRLPSRQIVVSIIMGKASFYRLWVTHNKLSFPLGISHCR